jgi:hypothetical protein
MKKVPPVLRTTMNIDIHMPIVRFTLIGTVSADTHPICDGRFTVDDPGQFNDE